MICLTSKPSQKRSCDWQLSSWASLQRPLTSRQRHCASNGMLCRGWSRDRPRTRPVEGKWSVFRSAARTCKELSSRKRSDRVCSFTFVLFDDYPLLTLLFFLPFSALQVDTITQDISLRLAELELQGPSINDQVSARLQSDDALLSGLQKLGWELEQPDPDEERAVEKLREICMR